MLARRLVHLCIPIILISLTHPARAEMSNRVKTILLMLGTGSVGATVGALTRPPNENIAPHAAMWGGIGAVTGGVTGLFLFDSESERERLSNENRKMSIELARFVKETEVVPLGGLPEGADMPTQVRDIIRPGKWLLYQIGEKGQWIKQSDKKWVHQDQLLLYQPGGVFPGNQSPGPRLDTTGLNFQPQTIQASDGNLSRNPDEDRKGEK